MALLARHVSLGSCIAPARPCRRTVLSVRAADRGKGTPKRPPTGDEMIDRGTAGKRRSFWGSMAFYGPAPEAINGRLAMTGFVAAMAAEIATGRGVLQQFWQSPLPILGAGAVVIVASLIPIIRGANLQESYGPWRPDAEIINGRVAMFGLVALFVTEYLKGSPLWTSGIMQ